MAAFSSSPSGDALPAAADLPDQKIRTHRLLSELHRCSPGFVVWRSTSENPFQHDLDVSPETLMHELAVYTRAQCHHMTLFEMVRLGRTLERWICMPNASEIGIAVQRAFLESIAGHPFGEMFRPIMGPRCRSYFDACHTPVQSELSRR